MKKIGTIVYIVFSIFFMILNILVGYSSSNRLADIFFYIVLISSHLTRGWYIDFIVNPSYDWCLVLSRIFMVLLGLVLCSKKDEKMKHKFMYGSIIPLGIVSLIIYFPILRTAEYVEFFNLLLNVDLNILGDQIMVSSIIILLGIYFINQDKKNPQARARYFSGGINVALGISGTALVVCIFLFFAPDIFTKAYYVVAYFNVVMGAFNLLLSYKLYKINNFKE